MTPTDKYRWIARMDWPTPLHPTLGPFKTDGRVSVNFRSGSVYNVQASDADWRDNKGETSIISAAIYPNDPTAQWADKAPKPGSDEHPVFAFLQGEGALYGVNFGETPEGVRGKFWWRIALRNAVETNRAELAILRASNAKLREALTRLRDATDAMAFTVNSSMADEAIELADAALKETE